MKKLLYITPKVHPNIIDNIAANEVRGNEIEVISAYDYGNIGAMMFRRKVPPIAIWARFILWMFQVLSHDASGKRNNVHSTLELSLAIPSFRWLKNEIMTFAPDVIVIKAYTEMFGLLTTLAVRTKGQSIIVEAEAYGKSFLRNIFWRLWSAMLERKCAHFCIVCPTRITTDYLNRIGVKAAEYRPFGVWVQDFSKQWFRDGRINVLTVAKITPRKRIDWILDGCVASKGTNNLSLTIIAAGSQREYEAYVRNRIVYKECGDWVHIVNSVDRQEMCHFYRNADLFVMASKDEPASYAIVEAMANKLGILCSDDCGTACYIKNNTNGVVFDSNSKNDFFEKLNNLLATRMRLIEMGNASYAIVKQQHDATLCDRWGLS